MLKQLDLGCGTVPRVREGYEVFGVDIADVPNKNVLQADLAIEPIPYDDDRFDLVTAHDFMEHIPNFVYMPVLQRYTKGKIGYTMRKHNSMIALFNEIYRVLKNGGEFYMESPMYPSNEAFQDPTHVFFWTRNTIHYFSGDYVGMHDHYGHTSKFELVSKQVKDEWRLYIQLRAIKPCEPPYTVGGIV